MAVLALLFALQDARVADTVRALDADDPDARDAAVRTLIELEADVTEIAKSADGEKRLRAQEVVTAVALFKKAPGLRALWKSDPKRVPLSLIARLAEEPRDQWPELLSSTAAGLPRAAREALSGDILMDQNACRKFLRELDSSVRRLEFDQSPPPLHTWWFCLAALQCDGLEGRQHAAVLLYHAMVALPLDAVDEVSTVLLARLYDPRVGQDSAMALVATMCRLKDDRARLRALVDALAARLVDDNPSNAILALGRVSDAAVQEVVIDRMLAACSNASPRVRGHAVRALYEQSLSAGPIKDRVVRQLLALFSDPEPSVRLAAIRALHVDARGVTSDALLAQVIHGLIARRNDLDRQCREAAASAIAYVANEGDPARFVTLLGEARKASTGTDATDAAHALYRLAEQRDAAITKARAAFASDDIDERTKAARDLVELDTDVDDNDIAVLVNFFRTAPGCRQAWRLRADAMPPALVAKLAAAPRAQWPELIGTALAHELLTPEVRIALAGDILADEGATESAIRAEDNAGWWFSLVALEAANPRGRGAAVAMLNRASHDVPERAARDIVDTLHRRLLHDSERMVQATAAQALVWTAGRFAKDEPYTRAILSPLVERLHPDEDERTRWDVVAALRGSVHDDVKRITIALIAELMASKDPRVRRSPFLLLPDLHPAKGPGLDAMVALLAATAEDQDLEVRRQAISLLLNGHMSSASDEPFTRATRSLLARLSDTDADCRRYAACKISVLAAMDRVNGDLRRDVEVAVAAALKREDNADVSKWLKDAAEQLRLRGGK